MLHKTRFEDTPFFGKLSTALAELLKSRPEEQMTFVGWHLALHEGEQHRLPDGRERYTPGQVKNALEWMVNNQKGAVRSVRVRTNYYGAEAQEENDGKTDLSHARAI